MFRHVFRIVSNCIILFKIISRVLGALAEFKVLRALAEFTFLGAFVHFKVSGALEEVKIVRALVEFKDWWVFASDLGFKSFESCLIKIVSDKNFVVSLDLGDNYET